MTMRRWVTRLRTLAALGAINVLRVLRYRFGLMLGIHPVQRIAITVPPGDVFPEVVRRPIRAAVPNRWGTEALLFGTHRVPIGAPPPDWTVDPFSGTAQGEPSEDLPPWWRIGDFDGGDIKRVWEFSRFDWAMTFAQRARNGDPDSLRRLNEWIGDWAYYNPPYRGPNWKCAQEASIRLLHLSVAALILGCEHVLSGPLRGLIDAHVQRILPTLSYARAQDNNHAVSEAAALFVAGSWFTVAGSGEGQMLVRRGRSLLEQHVARLFGRDGSFSQHSLNYHRLALDTLALVELWRCRAELTPFSAKFCGRAAAAAQWLRVMTDPLTGDAPNLGANDGANLLPLTDAPYRDHRFSVQLACRLFRGGRAYPSGPWDDGLAWLGLDPKEELPWLSRLPEVSVFDDGGFTVLRHGSAMALLRYPRFRFRPSQADVLHVDLWVDGANLLRDGGSYSYNTDAQWLEYFGGVRSHNTIEFDGKPQMPRLSRFLLGDWLTTEACGLIESKGAVGFQASYRARDGRYHCRTMLLGAHLRVVDCVAGFTERATLRWRLAPREWELVDGGVRSGKHRLHVCADVPILSMQILTEREARHYWEMTELPVLEVTIAQPGQITTEYKWTE